LRTSALPGDGKIGFATPKKLGCHARRNRQRRRLQAAIREIDRSKYPPLDLIVIASSGIGSVGMRELVEELEGVLRQQAEKWESKLASS
jgi:ribonuclease P protein component